MSNDAIISIDFGTSSCGYSVVFRRDPNTIRTHPKYEGAPSAYPKTATQLLYRVNETAPILEAFGFPAETLFNTKVSMKKEKDYAFIKNFKMNLQIEKRIPLAGSTFSPKMTSRHKEFAALLGDYTAKTTPEGPVIVSNGMRFLVVDLVAEVLKQLKKLAMESFFRDADESSLNIQWCLTVPAIWNDTGKHWMRMAAVKAGLISSSAADHDRLIIVIEPEAAIMYCRNKNVTMRELSFEKGMRFMVVDLGGGTADITVHEQNEDGTLREVSPPTGGPYGSSYLDNQFFQYLGFIFGEDCIRTLRSSHPTAVELLSQEWVKCKHLFSGSDQTSVNIPNPLFRILNKEFKEVFEKLTEDQDGCNDAIILSDEVMRDAIFNPILQGIYSEIEKHFIPRASEKSTVVTTNVDMMFLVGGFSQSEYIFKMVKERYKNKNAYKYPNRKVEICRPLDSGGAVVQGAALFGLKPDYVNLKPPAADSKVNHASSPVSPKLTAAFNASTPPLTILPKTSSTAAPITTPQSDPVLSPLKVLIKRLGEQTPLGAIYFNRTATFQYLKQIITEEIVSHSLQLTHIKVTDEDDIPITLADQHSFEHWLNSVPTSHTKVTVFVVATELKPLPSPSAPASPASVSPVLRGKPMRRRALVIGNDLYTSNILAKLKNAGNDARAMEAQLLKNGFEVVVGYNFSRDAMNRAINQFVDPSSTRGIRIQPKVNTSIPSPPNNAPELIVFYYAGHGLQINGENFLVPVDADFLTEQEVEDSCVNLNKVLKGLSNVNSYVNIIILDACRNNPFKSDGRAVGTRGGLARVDSRALKSKGGNIIMFATDPDNVAEDGSGVNGTFTKHLLSTISSPITLLKLPPKVTKAVKAETNDRQTPFLSSSLAEDEDIYFGAI